jgi:uncharacterized protein
MSQRKVVIVGAGAAGVFAAYRIHQLFGNQYEIVLLESSNRVGGNTFSTQVTYGGTNYNIDCGAQFFYKNPQPNYNTLLQMLGLEDPLPTGVVYAAPAGFTVWDKVANQRLFWVPSTVDGFMRYTSDDWDRIVEFALFLTYALFFDADPNADWTLSVDDWFNTLTLVSSDFKEKVIKPFLFQFVSLPLDRIGEASAKYAITYLARNLHDVPVAGAVGLGPGGSGSAPVFVTYQSTIGLDGILNRVLAAAGVTAQLSSPVLSVKRQSHHCVVTTPNGPISCADVVLTCDPHAAATILQAGGTTDPALIALLNSLEYAPLPISMQKDGACWMPSDSQFWEPINTIVDGTGVAFSAWFGPLRPTYGVNQEIPVFKSWGAPAVAGCSYEFLGHEHNVLMPTTTFVGLRDQLPSWQGRDGIFFAGGWTQWFDSQEAALDSATLVANALPGRRPRHAVPRVRPLAPATHLFNLLLWLTMIARHAPLTHAVQLATAIENVAFNG